MVTSPADPNERQPKGDHNRRLALGVDLDQFALRAGITAEQLKTYEMTPPDERFDLDVANNVGLVLEQLEASPPSTQKVVNS